MDLWLEVYISTKKKLMGTTRKNLYNDEEHLSDLNGSVLTFRLWVLCIICQFSNPVECYKRRLQKKTHVEEHQHTAQHLQLRHRNVVMTGEHLILLQKTLFQRERERRQLKIKGYFKFNKPHIRDRLHHILMQGMGKWDRWDRESGWPVRRQI